MRLEEGAEVHEEEEGLPGARKPEGAGEGALEEGSGGEMGRQEGPQQTEGGEGEGEGRGKGLGLRGGWARWGESLRKG